MSEPVSNCRTVLASNIAKPFIEELKAGVAKLDMKPLLVGFLANEDPAAKMYARWTGTTANDLGFEYDLREVPKEELEEHIKTANKDDNVHGILVYFPVFGGDKDRHLQSCVQPEKDVEGLSDIYVNNMYQNIRFLDEAQTLKSILPCTPLAVVKILEFLQVYNPLIPYGNRLYGKTITVINRSEIVGRPLAALLANDGAVVYSVDVDGMQKYTRGDGLHHAKHIVSESDLTYEEASLKSDVVVTGVPSPNYKYPVELIKYGAICINFSSEKNFSPEVKTRASLYVPMMGKVTIMMLLRNLLRLFENLLTRESQAEEKLLKESTETEASKADEPEAAEAQNTSS